jgi:hypothetical protein
VPTQSGIATIAPPKLGVRQMLLWIRTQSLISSNWNGVGYLWLGALSPSLRDLTLHREQYTYNIAAAPAAEQRHRQILMTEEGLQYAIRAFPVGIESEGFPTVVA